MIFLTVAILKFQLVPDQTNVQILSSCILDGRLEGTSLNCILTNLSLNLKIQVCSCQYRSCVYYRLQSTLTLEIQSLQKLLNFIYEKRRQCTFLRKSKSQIQKNPQLSSQGVQRNFRIYLITIVNALLNINYYPNHILEIKSILTPTVLYTKLIVCIGAQYICTINMDFLQYSSALAAINKYLSGNVYPLSFSIVKG